MNYDRVPNGAKWMLTSSFFHAAYEALLVNELRYLQLVERKVSCGPPVECTVALFDTNSSASISKSLPQPVSCPDIQAANKADFSP